MTANKKTPRLGRGLSSLMSTPVKVEPGAAELVRGIPAEAKQAPSEPANAVSAGTTTTQEPVKAPTNAGIMPGRGYNPSAQPPRHAVVQGQAGLSYLPITSLQPNRHQPRQRFDEAGLKRLADSIRSEGVMQPIVARPSGPGRYEVVAGERRLRAAQIAGLSTIPTIVRDLNDRQIAEWALIENLQREDLNPIERAEAFSRLINQFGLSHEEAGTRVGMDRSSISNHLRLLGLAGSVKQLIGEGLISMGQARALAGLSDLAQQQVLAERAVRKGLSVREVEAAVRKLLDGGGGAISHKPAVKQKPSHLADIEKQIAQQLGTKVAIRPGRKKGTGTLSIDFYSLDQFEALLGRFGVKTD